MEASNPSESPAVMEMTEDTTAPSGQDMMKDEQWRAMKKVIDAIYDFRQPE